MCGLFYFVMWVGCLCRGMSWLFFFFKQKTAYEMRISDWSSDVCSSDLTTHGAAQYAPVACAGPLLAAELDALGAALSAPKRPMVAIVAGSKVSTKQIGRE